jgi:endonuclease/exonuclease/phosphatase family metal-dependent hydrolase
MPRRVPPIVPIVAVIILLALIPLIRNQTAPPADNAAPGTYQLCFWNVENLFDDHQDNETNKVDKEFDTWFARDPAALHLKLDRLSEGITALNDGRGPDILALAEVENLRAAELLQGALNRRLPDSALRYSHLLMKDPGGGRHIATAILTRLPVQHDRTRLHGSRLRILEGHVVVNGHDLVILATHWTSRVTNETGGAREKYADQIYGVFRAMYMSNRKVDFLVCGDFNDPPEAPSVTDHLHATGDIQAVLEFRPEPLLFNLFADKNPSAGFGTHHFGKQWFIFDQIVVSPGLLDSEGWSCDPQSVRTINNLVKPGDRYGRPWRFGNEHERGTRGYSDHFPVTVRLRAN